MKTGIWAFYAKSFAARVFFAVCILLAGYLIFKYVLGVILPFIIAFSVAACINRQAERLSKATGASARLLSVFMLIVCLSVLFSSVFLILSRILGEGERLLAQLSDGEFFSELIEGLQSNGGIPFIAELSESDLFQKLIGQLDGVILSALPPLISAVTVPILSFLSDIPRLIIFISVTVISCFYFCLDYKKIKLFLLSHLPGGVLSGLLKIKNRAFSAARQYLKAQAILLFLTLSLLFVGFLILGVNAPFITACIVSLVDLLPVLGVGTVLIPWGLIEIMIFRNFFLGVGLLILYVTILIIRQVVEPKIVGRRLGIHPLAALIAVYVGFRFFGLLGAILAPLTVSVICSPLFSDIDKRPAL